tara:strand:+ start:96 stop:308 length:213 start_codon:yes stop_codon:yes gene_type:complete
MRRKLDDGVDTASFVQFYGVNKWFPCGKTNWVHIYVLSSEAYRTAPEEPHTIFRINLEVSHHSANPILLK